MCPDCSPRPRAGPCLRLSWVLIPGVFIVEAQGKIDVSLFVGAAQSLGVVSSASFCVHETELTLSLAGLSRGVSLLPATNAAYSSARERSMLHCTKCYRAQRKRPNFGEFPFQRLSGNSYARAKRLTMSRVIAA